MKEYPKYIASIVAVAGLCLLIFGIPYAKTYPALRFLLPVMTTLTLHSTQVAVIVQECRKEHRFAWKENIIIRKNCYNLLAMLLLYSVVILISIKAQLN